MDVYRNKKTKNLYVILNSNVINVTNSCQWNDTEMVLYRRAEDDGKWYVRSSWEFYEKFECVGEK